MAEITLWVDALSPMPGGIGRYTWELAKGLPSHPELDTVRFYGRNQLMDVPGDLLVEEPRMSRRGCFRKWLDKRVLGRTVFHGPNYFLPAFVESGVITVHDLSVFRYPETHPVERVQAFEREFFNSLSRAAHIITDTETVRDELIAAFGVREELVTAVLLGVDPTFLPHSQESLAPAAQAWGLKAGRYGLCVSTLEPRKKIVELLTAWRNLPRAVRDSYPLVLCGGAGWRNEELREQVNRGVTEGWLRHLGFVNEMLLPQLYAGAALFVYPSIYEGFGLPPIEAMASGVPVMVSHHSCLPEVCGDAARYFDPDDATTFSAAIEENLFDQIWRAESVDRGLTRAGQLTWNRCIEGTVEIYLKVASAV